jgi:polyisoprenoid-binding protein YceI
MKIKATVILLFFSVFAFAQDVKLHPANIKEAVTFSIHNFGLATKGSFDGLKGDIVWNASNLSSSSFAVSVDAGTVNTGVDSRDAHLKKEEYFDVAKYAVISFTSTSISGNNGTFTVQGNLAIKGVTKNISFPFTVKQEGSSYVFDGSFSINRRDFHVGGGSMVLSDDVKVTLHVTAAP